jgi:hydrogenase nickel incorporation protein HypB
MSNADSNMGNVILVDVREPDDAPLIPPGDPLPGAKRTADLQVRLLDQNDRQAAENRAALKARGIRALNFVSSPGSGKTALLERTLDALAGEVLRPITTRDDSGAPDCRSPRSPPEAPVTLTPR